MKGFTIIPKDYNEHVRVQKLLFRGGFSWSGDKEIKHVSNCSISTGLPRKFLNNDSLSDTPFLAIETANTRGKKVITAKEFLNNPKIIEGWDPVDES